MQIDRMYVGRCMSYTNRATKQSYLILYEMRNPHTSDGGGGGVGATSCERSADHSKLVWIGA